MRFAYSTIITQCEQRLYIPNDTFWVLVLNCCVFAVPVEQSMAIVAAVGWTFCGLLVLLVLAMMFLLRYVKGPAIIPR